MNTRMIFVITTLVAVALFWIRLLANPANEHFTSFLHFIPAWIYSGNSLQRYSSPASHS